MSSKIDCFIVVEGSDVVMGWGDGGVGGWMGGEVSGWVLVGRWGGVAVMSGEGVVVV